MPTPPSTARAEVEEAERLRIAGLTDAQLEASVGAQVKHFCSTCHSPPVPEAAPREEWEHEVDEAYKFHRSSPQKDEPAPNQLEVVEYFRRKATPYDDLPVPPLGDAGDGGLKFERSHLTLAANREAPALPG